MELFDYLLAKTKAGGGGSDLDWSAIGYNSTPKSIVDGYNYAKDIYDNWNSSATNLSDKYKSNNNLLIMPLVDTSNVTNMHSIFQNSSLISLPLLDTHNVTDMGSMFYYCTNLKTVPLLNTSSVTNVSYMFYYCNILNNTSLDNILQMCINATSYTGTKTLNTLGITNTTYYPVSRIQALPHYQDFINAGWTIGY